MTERESINTGRRTLDEIDELLTRAASVPDAGARIALISGIFAGTEYRESTLVGNGMNDEVFVINLEALDCFTFIDYVEAMRLSNSFGEFKENLKKIRYRGAIVSFSTRNHFFSDWVEYNSGSVYDATEDVGLAETKVILKVLNMKRDGTLFVPGIGTVRRDLKYIPSSSIDETMLCRLKSGDYIGIYSDLEGLDVTHVGILIKNGDDFILRHASSKKEIRRVVDQSFLEYVRNKPGIIVLRAK